MKGIKSLKKISIITSLLLISGLNATFERHMKSMTCTPSEVHFIDPTSNYATESTQFISDIYLTGELIKTAIIEGSQGQISAFNDEIASLVGTMIDIQQTSLKDKLKQDNAQKEKEMAYQANIAEEKVRQSKSVLFKDDTKEEMALIVKYLEENSDYTVPKITLSLVAEFDNGGEQIPIPIKAAEGICSDEDVEDGYCSIMRSITPGKKLAKFFKACNEQKIALVEKKQTAKSNNASIVANAKKSNEVVNNVNSVSKQVALTKEQLKGSCNVNDYKNKLCGQSLSQEDFQEKVALNHIIPNGHISPDNLLIPSFYGGADLRKYDAATIANLKDKALSKDEVQGEASQQSYVPIVYTYKNTNQYATAIQYVDNISGSFIVSNQDPDKRKLKSSASFQALYLKRMATLSLVRNSFMDAVKRRRGSVISDAVLSGDDITISDDPIKESVLGASQYDILLNRVDKVFAAVAVKATAKLGESASTDELTNGSEKALRKINIETLKLQTEIMFKSLMEDEKIELLKAAQISNMVNSPDMISYLQQLRR